MPQIHNHVGPAGAISRRVREREIRRQVRYNDARKAATRSRIAVQHYVAKHTPPLVREFLETLLGSLIGFLVIAELLAHLAHVNAIYTVSVFGLFYSLQSTYYKYKITVDPEFKIPSCRCARPTVDGTEGVLQSRYSAILGVPSSAFAAAFFSAVLILTAIADSRRALPLAIVAVVASIYLSYVMLVKIRSLCATCINIATLSALILWLLLV